MPGEDRLDELQSMHTPSTLTFDEVGDTESGGSGASKTHNFPQTLFLKSNEPTVGAAIMLVFRFTFFDFGCIESFFGY